MLATSRQLRRRGRSRLMQWVWLWALAALVLPAGESQAAEPPLSNAAASFEWLRNARVFILDAYTYPLFPEIEFDAEKLAETMVDMHANTLRVATSGNYWLVPGTPFQTAPNLGDRDILAECVAACKRRGIRVVPYVRTGGAVAAEIVPPEWAYRADPQGKIPVRWDLGTRRSAFCWNTGYRQAFLELIERLVTRYDIDGIYFDAWKAFYRFQYPRVCYCAGCRQGFKKATGLELPYREDPNRYTAEEWKTIARYQQWYREQLLAVFRQTKRLIRSHKNIPLIFNLNHARFIGKSTFTHPQIVEESDAFLYEMSGSMLERIEGVSLAVSHGLAVWPYSDAYHGYPRIGVYCRGQQQHILATMAFGGSPTVYHSYFYVDHPQARQPIREAFGTFARSNEFVEGFRPAKFCAVVWNDSDPPGHARRGFLWKTDARLCTSGALAACLDEHIQVTSLLQSDLARREIIEQYRVIYLADICSLSTEQVSALEQYVAAGGGLVMSYCTSLYDASGKRRRDFALGKLAAVKLTEPDPAVRNTMQATEVFGSTWDLYLKARPQQQLLRGQLSDELIPAAVYQPVEALSGSTVVADIVVGNGTERLFPGIVASRYGKGRVVYLAPAVEAMYRQTRIRQFAQLMGDAVVYAGGEPPFQVHAPSGLIANMMCRDNTRVVHLINWTGCKTESPRQNAYYIPPIDNVVVRIAVPGGKRVREVSLLVPDRFSQHMSHGTLEVVLPRVHYYQGIAVRFE